MLIDPHVPLLARSWQDKTFERIENTYIFVIHLTVNQRCSFLLQRFILCSDMMPLLPIAEGYPAVQCQFPRRQAHSSPSPTQISPANSTTAHQRLARCSAKVLLIAACTARAQLSMKTTSARQHLVEWRKQACTFHTDRLANKIMKAEQSCAFTLELSWLPLTVI